MFSAVDVFLASARALRFVREEPRNSNAGQAVEAFLAVCGLGKGAPWCMAFVHFIGRSCFGALWPLTVSASCQTTFEDAQTKGCVIATSELRAGDLLFVWHPSLNRYGHVAIVAGTRVTAGVPTIEGNTNDGGSRDGWGVFSRVRATTPHDAGVRWTTALRMS